MRTRRCSGGCFDDEFKTESVRFFEEVRQGQFVVVVSNVTLDELELAPDPVGGVPTCLRSGSRSLARRRSQMDKPVLGSCPEASGVGAEWAGLGTHYTRSGEVVTP